MNGSRAVALLGLLFAVAPARGEAPRAARGNWTHLAAPGFELLTNGSEKPARELLAQLATFRESLRQLMPNLVVEAPDPIQVLLFARHADLRPYLPQSPDGKPAEMGALYLGSRGGCSAYGDWIALSNDIVDDVPGVVFHEFAHFLTKQNLGDAPIWLNEGLAEYYSTFHFARRARKIEIGRPVVDHMRWLASVPAPTVGGLLAVDTTSPDYNEEARQGSFYAKAWLLVHYLQAGSAKDDGALTRFLGLRSRGLDDATALQQAIGRPLTTLDDELLRYQRKSLISYRVFEAPAVDAVATATSRPATNAEALYRLGIFLTRLGPQRVAEATAHFAAIREKEPSSPLADLGEAESAIFWGNAERALPLLRQVRAADPSSVSARRLLAGAVARSTQNGPLRIDAAKEAKAALEEALALDGSRRDDWLLYVSLVSMAQPETSEVVAAASRLQTALRRFPRDFELTLGIAQLYHRAGEFDRAASVALEAAANAPPERRRDFERIVFTASMASANRLAGGGHKDNVETGRRLLMSRLEALRDPTIRAQMQAQFVTFEKSNTDRYLVERHNEAVALINAAEYSEALDILREILRSDPEPGLAESTRSLIARVENYLTRTKKKR